MTAPGPASARDADRLTYEFVSIASHELRAPIAVVHGIAATLDARVDELPGEQVHALLRQLVVQTDRLRDLADQLLDLSRIESGAAAGPPEQFDPGTRLEGLVPRIAGDRATDVHLLVESGLMVVADPVAFERVAENLILNALRYGAPPVEVRVEADPCLLIVEDRGPGVSPAFVPRLFERFSRSDESRRSGSSGAGLGLSIASAYAKALGGELAYEPAEPRGARFTLSLPAARS